MISHRCRRMLLASSQTIDGTGLTMRNRAEQHAFPGHTVQDRPLGSLWGWEPTELLFLNMLATAQFANPRVVSTSPHPGEVPGRKCGTAPTVSLKRRSSRCPCRSSTTPRCGVSTHRGPPRTSLVAGPSDPQLCARFADLHELVGGVLRVEPGEFFVAEPCDLIVGEWRATTLRPHDLA